MREGQYIQGGFRGRSVLKRGLGVLSYNGSLVRGKRIVQKRYGSATSLLTFFIGSTYERTAVIGQFGFTRIVTEFVLLLCLYFEEFLCFLTHLSCFTSRIRVVVCSLVVLTSLFRFSFFLLFFLYFILCAQNIVMTR